MKLFNLSFALLLLTIPRIFAQETKATPLTLKACVQLAVEKNINVQMARMDQQQSVYKVDETRAALLPKIDINGSFQDNLKLPVTVFPGDLIGQPGTTLAVKMGSNYNTSASISFSQVLYSQTSLIALKLSKKSTELNTLGIEKASEELTSEVSKLYFLYVTTARQKKLIEENIARTRHLGDIIKIQVENGMSRQIDAERVNVNLGNLYTQLNNTDATLAQQLNMIKYTLEIPFDETIALTDSAEMPLMQFSSEMKTDFTSHIEIQMLESQKEINRLQQKEITSGYLPTLSFNGQFGYQGMRQDFKNYFQSDVENKWYASSFIGLNLSIPIFAGLERRSKSRQSTLEYQKTAMTLDNTKKRFGVDYQNALNNYQNQKNNVQRQKLNTTLAEDVFQQTALKYREGLASMSDLLQDEMGLSNAQANYLNGIYNFKEAELKIMSLNGEIKNLFNK